jgi:putative ABC transport system permease protein
MNIRESLEMSLGALRSNKFRSTLTTLGVSIGVGAVILLVAIGSGVKQEMSKSIQGLGTNLVFVFASQPEGTSAAKSFTQDDLERVKARLTDVVAVVPVFQQPVTARSGNKTTKTVILGGDEDYFKAFETKIETGRYYRRNEAASGTKVATIGQTVKEKLFPTSDPIGKTVTIEGQRFKVIGVAAKRGGSVMGDNDNGIYVPMTAGFAVSGTRELQMLAVKVYDSKDISLVEAKIERILRSRYSDVATYSQDQTVGAFGKSMSAVTMMLAGIASISLLVGGIGIMNIMLVSVTERTREIGIRKAVGARTGDVLTQFVIEAIVLSIIGGGVGILLGAGGAFALSPVMTTRIEVWSVVMAVVFSAAIGIFFGVYPAAKASRLDPIVALRHD